jgi:rhodanese-related sulfurtransferase
VDVRTAEERKADGVVPIGIHVAWQTGPHFIRNPSFLRELKAKVATDGAILFICRSGLRSADAAVAAAKAGFRQVFNVRSGIEGDPDEHGRTGTLNGWRSEGLPWTGR